MNNAEAALDVLKGLLSGKYKVVSKDAGLCTNFQELLWRKHSINLGFNDFICHYDLDNYDKFTGNPSVPVPHPQDATGEIYFVLSFGTNFWDKRTVYGRNRWEFVQFCADTLERKIQEGNYD